MEVDARSKNGQSPLVLAAAGGHEEVVETLLRAGADADAKDRDGLTPLHCAALEGHPRVVEALRQAEADGGAPDGDGCPTLFHAVVTGDLEAARVLLAEGADVAASAKGGLHMAATIGNVGIVEALLHAGANVQDGISVSCTPLSPSRTA